MKRGEIWLADLGYVGKVRPVLILSVEPGDEDRALVTYVVRTTSVRGTAYEILHHVRGMKPGAFDAQGIGTTDRSHFLRKLGVLEETFMRQVEGKTRAWLGL
jgi:mRNA-degrading endonuclease toxin of MazEF toxin-antitoxin module